MRGFLIPEKGPTDINDVTGFSVYVSVGRWAGVGGGIDGALLRVTLGWVGIGVGLFDLERFLGMLARKLRDDGLMREAAVLSEETS
jgi:hypothetical protein